MYTLIIAFFISIVFYFIAVRNQQNGTEPACLSILIFYVGLFFGILVLGSYIMIPLFAQMELYYSPANMMIITGLITGIFATLLYYFWLKKNWKEKRIKSSIDILDDEMLD